MARKTISELTGLFENGDTPSGADFASIFDSNFNLQETGTQVASGSLTLLGGQTISGSLKVSGSILPDGSGSHDLGSEAHPWGEIYVISSSINFMSNDGRKLATISVDEDGNLETTPSGSTTPDPIASFPFVGDAVITGSLLISGSQAFILDTTNVVLGQNAGGGTVDTGTDDNNVIIGTDAAGGGALNSGDNNIVIGHSAGYALSTGDNNIIIGYEAGKVNTATANTFIGSRSGQKNTTGYYNTFVGRDSGMECVEWQNNTYVGYASGRYPQNEMNTAVGAEALYGASGTNTAEQNVALGYRALYSIASNGDGNVGIGHQAGYDIAAGTHNINIGFGVTSIAAAVGDIRIGSGSSIPFSGSSVTGDVLFPSTASAAYFSGDGSNLTNLQRPITTVSANPFTASADNAGEYFRAGGNITCSIFPNSSVSCPVGSEFELIQTSSAGNLLITGSGVTINSKDGYLKLAGQFSAATLKKVGTDEWDLVGDLAE